jgi:hypothetical protein
MSDQEQFGTLFSLTLSSASIPEGSLYRDLVERLLTDGEFESGFIDMLRGSGLVLLGASLDHGIALAQEEGQNSIFCANRSDFSDGRYRDRTLKRMSYVRMATVVAVCAAAFPKNAETGNREMISFSVDDVVAIMKKAASEAVLPGPDDPVSLPEPEDIIASVIQDTPTDDRNEGAVKSIKANAQKTMEALVNMGYLIERPANADGVIDYSPHWKLTKLVQHFASKTLVARLREAA